MGRCAQGTSQCVLLVTNTLIFLCAAGALGVTIYMFNNVLAKSLSKVNLLTIVGIFSVALMLFAMLGCRTATSPPKKKCSKCIYLTLLLVLFLGEFVAAGYIFNISNALQVAKDHHFDVTSHVDEAATKALHFLHDQLDDLYNQESCRGGAATGTQTPFNFTKVVCETQSANDAFNTLLTDPTVATQSDFKSYKKCTVDKAYTQPASAFTQAFCGSQANIVTLAHRYSRYLVWFPVVLAGLTFILLVSTICLMAQKNQQHQRRQVQLNQGQQPINRVQMSGP
jgi:hypothetical protein